MIAITAASAALGVANGRGAWAKSQTPQPVIWRGIALGAAAQIILYHEDRAAAASVLERCRAEIVRLENLFSLYRPQSHLNRLNRDGVLKNPDFDMIELFSRAKELGRQTGGVFDISVQPLWALYREHFSNRDMSGSGPSQIAINEALRLVDVQKINVSPEMIEFGQKGMAVTCNGIAQGFITDQIAALLKGAGFKNTLLNLGEIAAIGGKPDGASSGQASAIPWRVGIQNPDGHLGGERNVLKTLSLKNQAMATSASSGTLFTKDGKHHHLFDPRTGASTHMNKSVSVIAPDATTADALSTAFSALAPGDIRQVLKAYPNTRAIVFGRNEEMYELG